MKIDYSQIFFLFLKMKNSNRVLRIFKIIFYHLKKKSFCLLQLYIVNKYTNFKIIVFFAMLVKSIYKFEKLKKSMRNDIRWIIGQEV